MSDQFDEKLEEVIWVAHQLFNRKLVTGSTGNISFLFDNRMYISISGSCFGRLDKGSFAIVTLSGEVIEGKPSKEYPLHLSLYNKNTKCKGIIHTHSLYSTMISCMDNIEKSLDKLYSTTPYLKMLTNGKIEIVPYRKPGSEELFHTFSDIVKESTVLSILQKHGIIVSAESIYTAFNIMEEFEISCNLRYLLHQCFNE